MQNLKSLADDVLLGATRKLVENEREILSKVLHHLREIERRRLYSQLKYGSLYEYATKELGYSEDQAYRRIQAMRLLKDLPEIEEKINDGSLSLAHLGMAHSFFKREEKFGDKTYTKQEKIDLLQSLEKTSKREAERITISLSSAPPAPVEKIKTVSKVEVEIKFTADEALLQTIQRLKGLLAHKNPNMNLAELFDLLCNLGLEKWDKTLSAPAQDKPHQEARSMIPSKAQVRHIVWRKAQGKCQSCNSSYALEIDHIQPKSMGGSDSLSNLRLLCRSCNQRAAIQALGIAKMEKYLGG